METKTVPTASRNIGNFNKAVICPAIQLIATPIGIVTSETDVKSFVIDCLKFFMLNILPLTKIIRNKKERK